VLVDALDRERGAFPVVGREPLHLPRVLADEVAPRRPDREDELHVASGRVDLQLDVEEVPVRLRHRESVVHAASNVARDQAPVPDFC
jgi:hypothetical protein